MASTYLGRTVSATGSKQKATLSMWTKRSGLGINNFYGFYESGTSNFRFRFDGNDKIDIENYKSSSTVLRFITNRVFRDVGAFYNIVVEIDTTQATEANRFKLYINGVQETSFSTATYPSQNLNLTMNEDGHTQQVGSMNGTNPYNGLISYAAYVDGTAYDASYFGETDSSSGIWKIKTSPSVTYGTNGFFLKMDTSSPGTDTSGNSNTFTASGTPTLTQDNASNNFATLNTLTYQAASQSNSGTIQAYDGNTTWKSQGSNQWGTIFSTIAPSTGKWYSEVKVGAVGGGAIVGVVDVADARANSATEWYIGQSSTGQGYQNNGSASNGGASYGASYTTGDIIGCAMDLDNNKIYWSKNGTFQNSGVPTSGATGTGALTLTANTNYAFAVTGYNTTTMNCNFGNGFFGTTAVASSNADAAGHGLMEYPVPTGYYTLNTKNLNTYG